MEAREVNPPQYLVDMRMVYHNVELKTVRQKEMLQEYNANRLKFVEALRSAEKEWRAVEKGVVSGDQDESPEMLKELEEEWERVRLACAEGSEGKQGVEGLALGEGGGEPKGAGGDKGEVSGGPSVVRE